MQNVQEISHWALLAHSTDSICTFSIKFIQAGIVCFAAVPARHDFSTLKGLTILQAQNDFRCSVESADQIGSDLIVPRKHGTAKISQLHHSATCTDQDVVWLDVSMQHSTVAQVIQGDEHLS